MEAGGYANTGEAAVKKTANVTSGESPRAKLRGTRILRKYFLYRGRKQCLISAGLLLVSHTCFDQSLKDFCNHLYVLPDFRALPHDYKHRDACLATEDGSL